jgi:hypothetical protein
LNFEAQEATLLGLLSSVTRLSHSTRCHSFYLEPQSLNGRELHVCLQERILIYERGIRDPGLAEFKDTEKIEGCCKPEKKLLLLNCETMHEVGMAIQW